MSVYKCAVGAAALLAVLFAGIGCESGKGDKQTAERVLNALPQVEISGDPAALAPLVASALSQILPGTRYWELTNIEAALDFAGFEPGQPGLFAGLPLAVQGRYAPRRVPRRQEETSCPARVVRSETPTDRIDFDLVGGCNALLDGIPVRYEGKIAIQGDYRLGGFEIHYRWEDWLEESPYGGKKVGGAQILRSLLEEDGRYSLAITRTLSGITSGEHPYTETFDWSVSGQDGQGSNVKSAWLIVSGGTTTGVVADLRSTAQTAERGKNVSETSTDGTVEFGLDADMPLAPLSGGRKGRFLVQLEGIRVGACPGDRREPTDGRMILESLNEVAIEFSDACDGCGALADGRKACWAEAAPEEKPGGTSLEPPAEPIAPEPPVPPTPVVPVPVLEPTFTAEIQIVPNQVSLPSQDVAVALPEGYRTINVEGDVSGIFFDRAEGVRGLAVTSAAEAGSLAIKLGDVFKKGVRLNGTSMPAETTATISTVNSLRLTSVDGKPMTLQTFSLGFSAPRAWESVTAQTAAAVGAPGKTDVSMPGIDLGSASGVSSKEYVAMVGSVPRESGKSLHAAAVVPLESFDERSVEMFQTVGAVTRANAWLAKKEETFVAQAQGPQINVSSSVVDVLWVIDDSGSMSEEQSNLAANFDAFFRQFRALNLDYHLGVVTSDCDKTGGSSSSYYSSKALCGTLRKLSNGAVYIDLNTPQAGTEWGTISRPGTSGSGNEKPLLAAREALTSRVTDKSNSGFRRADASLVVILVTDEEDQSYEGAYTNSRAGSTYTAYTPPTPFTEFMQTQGAAVFAITGDPADSYSTGGCSSVNGSAEPGNAVIEVAESSGGSWASICSSTFAPTLSLISQSIGTRASRFKLSQPALASRIRVFVDGIEVRRSLTQKVGGALQAQDGFVYDIVSRTISFTGTRFTPKPGQTVRVVYLVVEGTT